MLLVAYGMAILYERYLLFSVMALCFYSFQLFIRGLLLVFFVDEIFVDFLSIFTMISFHVHKIFDKYPYHLIMPKIRPVTPYCKVWVRARF